MGARIRLVDRTEIEPLVTRGAIDAAVVALRRRRLHQRAPKATYRHACGQVFDSMAVAFAHLASCRRTP
jgi:hypothetical protein